MLKKNGRKCKQSEMKTGGEIKVNDVEVMMSRLAPRVRIKMSPTREALNIFK